MTDNMAQLARQAEHGQQCESDWGSAMASQRCTRTADHKGVHIDGDGREFGYEADEADPWGVEGQTRAEIMSSSPRHYRLTDAEAESIRSGFLPPSAVPKVSEKMRRYHGAV